MQVDARVDVGMIRLGDDEDRRRPLRQMALGADLAAGVAPAFERGQQPELQLGLGIARKPATMPSITCGPASTLPKATKPSPM